MSEKLIDVFDPKGKHLFTYPIVLGGLNYDPIDSEFLDLAKKLAVEDALATAADQKKLTARIRVQA